MNQPLQLTHACYAPGCKTPIKIGFLMCGKHWKKVDLKTRNLVNQAWISRVHWERHAKKHPQNPTVQEKLGTAIREHLEACQKAREEVRLKESN